ncbi:tRNA (uracil(54)-C(5))-methyltransferase homolog isoform X2 [Acanthaster planci]|uniref:tRNA (uracil(54)-C(5))-methyltransferase n=1 Tax=Acanthaster planci TaxID=133434 RepID=A0A8B7Y9N8_ACAPL|nr:tRNA (uracil(54)-C(5))-methyltransferase homolog isoform X2 [Acanthaster planci]
MAAPFAKHLARAPIFLRIIHRQCSTQVKATRRQTKKLKAQTAPPPQLSEPLPQEFTPTFTITEETIHQTDSANYAQTYLKNKLRKAVTPLWKLPYKKQLELKQLRNSKVLMKLTNSLIEQEAEIGLTETLDRTHRFGGLCCQLDTIKPSPVTEGYRNKSELSVGVGADGNRKTVGLFIGEWKKKNIICLPSDPARNISQAHKNVEKAYQTFLLQSSLDVSLSFKDNGNWRGLVVRSNQEGDLMAIVSFTQSDLSETETEDAMLSLQDFFAYGEGKDCGLSSLYFQSSFRTRATNEDAPFHLLLGKPHLHETLFDLQFRISPDAFFQVNTPATEVLYSTVMELCDLGQDTTVLDLCCGTGTIGLVMADRVKEVVGVEVIQQAVEDARVNAELNAISNATFVCGPVEEILPDILPTLEGSGDLVVVANPARAGLHPRVIRIIRSSQSIRRLVYISCKPDGTAARNFTDLCCPPTTRLHGKPFTLTRAVPVDLFPDTYHCELALLFER